MSEGKHLHELAGKLRPGKAVVVRKKRSGRWIMHGESIDVDTRVSGGMLIDTRFTGACNLSEDVMVFYRTQDCRIVVLRVAKSKKRSIFDRLTQFSYFLGGLWYGRSRQSWRKWGVAGISRNERKRTI
ncbi:MAG: hypothetical protein WC819_02500 [Parcubacteria group bacterium]|jgi:hypothetical protein